jgi:hypothetical protein
VFVATAVDEAGGDKTCVRVPTAWEDIAGSFRITFQGSGGRQETWDDRGTAVNYTF